MAVTVPTLGEQLRAVREARGLTLRDVARVAGALSWQAIHRIEVGQRQPTAASLVALSRGLGVRFEIDSDGIRLGS